MYTELANHGCNLRSIMPEDENKSADLGIHVIIIGAGLAGLATAISTKIANPLHRITVCEAVKELQEVGVSACVALAASTATRSELG